MTEQEIELGIGTAEEKKLEAKLVKIENAEITPVGTKGNKKVVLTCKHPDKPESIKISSAKVERNKKLQVVGLWVNLDDEGKIQKGSPLAMLLVNRGAANIKALIGQENVPTVEGDDGYLCIKAY